MKFRDIEDADIPAVVALWTACDLTRAWNDPLQDIQLARRGEHSTVIIGEVEGRIVASVMVGHDGHRGGLYYLSVHPEFQKQGFGKLIHDAAAEWLRSRGVWKINLLVRSDNAGVAGFYESLGYAANPVLSFGKRID